MGAGAIIWHHTTVDVWHGVQPYFWCQCLCNFGHNSYHFVAHMFIMGAGADYSLSYSTHLKGFFTLCLNFTPALEGLLSPAYKLQLHAPTSAAIWREGHQVGVEVGGDKWTAIMTRWQGLTLVTRSFWLFYHSICKDPDRSQQTFIPFLLSMLLYIYALCTM
jgi:hypothetical protein